MVRPASSSWGPEFDPQNRAGYDPRGPLAEFRDFASNDLLWEACMVVLPRKDDMVGYGVGAEGAPTLYEVIAVTWEFRKLMTDDEEGEPQEHTGALCYSKPVVRVTAQ